MSTKTLAMAACLTASVAQADMFAAPDAQAALGRELLQLFLDEPEILQKALYPPVVTADEIYADDIAADLERIGKEAQALFASDGPKIGTADGPVLMALFVDEGCDDCALARDELSDILQKLGIAARVFDLSKDTNAQAIMGRLTLDTVPAYVMSDRMIRGHMPPFVIERYLAEADQ